MDWLLFGLFAALMLSGVPLAVAMGLAGAAVVGAADLGMLSLCGTLLCTLHPLVFGWHLGFPVPPPPVYFFPYFGALFLGALNVVALLFCGFGWASQGWLKLSGTLERTRQDV